MRLGLRQRIGLNLAGLVLLFGLGGTMAATLWVNRATVEEEQHRTAVYLRSAWSALDDRLAELAGAVTILAVGPVEPAALEAVRARLSLDFLGLTDAAGRVVRRGWAGAPDGDDLSRDPAVGLALAGRAAQGFVALAPERLGREGQGLAERASLALLPTPLARPSQAGRAVCGLCLVAAAPLQDAAGRVTGAVYAGRLLTRDFDLVDRIAATVFEGQTLDNRPVGTVTIFADDVRVATNVRDDQGRRAVGTRVSAEVADRVLGAGRSYLDRAFVVNDWYLSAYEPIRDLAGRTVGLLYVGVLAKKFDELRLRLWEVYGGLTLGAVLLVLAVGLVFARRLTGAVGRLAQGSARLAQGELELRLPEPRADDELRDLTRAFNSLAQSLQDREARINAAQAELEAANTELKKLSQHHLEMLGFVSHELKNTLGVILTSAKTLDLGLTGPLNDKQARLVKAIAKSMDAAVGMTRRYLDLSRIEKGELRVQPARLDLLADVVRPVLEELKQAAAERHSEIINALPEGLSLTADPNLLPVVFRNLIGNAIKYGREGGQIRLGYGREEGRHRFEVWNEGPGLSPENLAKLFGKFVRFRHKDEADSRGTGLGLFITRDIVLKHSGEIWAESEEGRWMNFLFTLPEDQASVGS